MTGHDLHHYDQQLCDYLTGNIAEHLGQSTFRAELEAVITSAPLLDYLKQVHRGEVDDAGKLLLNADELYRLELTIDAELDRSWTPSEPVHRRHIETLQEVRDALSRQTGEQWADDCARFSRQLEGRGVRLSEGISVVREWVGRLRGLLRVIGAVDLLPAPEGGFPTPTCPEPPPTLCQRATTLARPVEQEAASLKTMLAETQALQLEVRDLLLTQKTIKEFYSTAEVATMLGKSEFTVREWCRLGRVHAHKQGSGRGKHQAWVISHDELQRLQREGLLPPSHAQ